MMRDVTRATEGSKSITAVRANGSSLWIDTNSAENAVNLRAHLAAKGVLVKPNGAAGVMVKPALTLEEHQASALATAISGF